MQILYNNDDLLDEEHKSSPNELIEKLKLTEDYVDNDYKIKYINDDDKLILERLREMYGDRSYYPITYQELRRSIYSLYLGVFRIKLHNADLVRICRVFWRAGEFRRFYVGKIRKYKNDTYDRHNYYGVHYILYPKHKSLDNVKLIEINWEIKDFKYKYPTKKG